MQEQEALEVTVEMIRETAWVAGLDVSEEQVEEMAQGVNRNLSGQAELFDYRLDNSVAPPIFFSPLVPGMEIDRTERPFRISATSGVRRPSDLEHVNFWPLASLGELIRSRQVTSVELTEMYIGRLARYNPTYNNVVTFTEDLARTEARRADAEIASGHYRGPLHGLTWGAKYILAVRGYPTTWGSVAFKEQVTEHEASVVRLLREAGRRPDRQADDGRAGRRRPLVRRADKECVEPELRLKQLIGRAGFGDRRRMRPSRDSRGNERVDPESFHRDELYSNGVGSLLAAVWHPLSASPSASSLMRTASSTMCAVPSTPAPWKAYTTASKSSNARLTGSATTSTSS